MLRAGFPSETALVDVIGFNPLLFEKLTHAVSPILGKPLVVLRRASAVCMTLHADVQVWIGLQDSGDFRKPLTGARLQRIPVDVKKDVRHIHYKFSRRFSRVCNTSLSCCISRVRVSLSCSA